MHDGRDQWTRNDVPQFLNEFFRGDVTLSQLVGEARRRFPNHKLLIHMEVDRYIELFVLDLLRIVTTSNVVDALLTVETPGTAREADAPLSDHSAATFVSSP